MGRVLAVSALKPVPGRHFDGLFRKRSQTSFRLVHQRRVQGSYAMSRKNVENLKVARIFFSRRCTYSFIGKIIVLLKKSEFTWSIAILTSATNPGPSPRSENKSTMHKVQCKIYSHKYVIPLDIRSIVVKHCGASPSLMSSETQLLAINLQ